MMPAEGSRPNSWCSLTAFPAATTAWLSLEPPTGPKSWMMPSGTPQSEQHVVYLCKEPALPKCSTHNPSMSLVHLQTFKEFVPLQASRNGTLRLFACRRRLVKRIYIPLPDDAARRSMITGMLQGQASKLKSSDIDRVVHNTDGYSGSDIRALCREAAMVPIRC